MDRIIKIIDKEIEAIFTNRAKALLEQLENKPLMEIITEITEKMGVIKIDTVVNLVYAGVKYAEGGNKINRDELYDLLPMESSELAKITAKLLSVLLHDTALMKYKDTEGKK